MELIKQFAQSPKECVSAADKAKKEKPLSIPRSSPYSTSDKKQFEKYQKVLPGYEFRELIDKGSMGKVYKAVHTETGKPVAIKYIKNAFDHSVLAMQLVREI